MKILQCLQVSFDTPIQPWELTQFRGAMAAKVGFEHEWFHNHNQETGGFHHRYPKIQYKVESKDGETHPMILCMDEGIEEAQRLFTQSEWGITIGHKTCALRITNLQVQQYNW